MTDVENLTIAILREIRDEIRSTNARLDQTREELGARIDQMGARIDDVRDTLGARIDATNTRLDRVVQEQIRQGTTLVKVVEAIESLDRRQDALEAGVGRVVDELERLNARIDNVFVGPMGTTVRDHEQRLTALERKVG